MILQGVYTALVTPFCNGKVDYEAFKALLERQIAGNVSFSRRSCIGICLSVVRGFRTFRFLLPYGGRNFRKRSERDDDSCCIVNSAMLQGCFGQKCGFFSGGGI